LDVRRPFSSIRWIRISMASTLCAALVVLRDPLSFAAAPETEPLRVEMTAPASCPIRPTLFERVRSHTGRVREASAGESSRALRVVIAPDGDRFVADLRLVEDDEVLERRVPGKTCEEVLAAVALIAALAIDPLASAVPVDAGAPQADVEPPPAPPPPPPPRRAPVEIDAGPPARRRGSVSAGVTLEAYGLGELVLGRGVWVEGALATRASPALRLRFARTQSFSAEREQRTAFFQLTTAAVDGCLTAVGWKPKLHRGANVLELRPCVQLAGGVLEGSSSAFGVHRMPRPWASIGAMLQERWRFFGPLELEMAVGLTLPLIRDDFFFLPRDDVYRAPSVVLLGNVGVGTTFR